MRLHVTIMLFLPLPASVVGCLQSYPGRRGQSWNAHQAPVWQWLEDQGGPHIPPQCCTPLHPAPGLGLYAWEWNRRMLYWPRKFPTTHIPIHCCSTEFPQHTHSKHKLSMHCTHSTAYTHNMHAHMHTYNTHLHTTYTCTQRAQHTPKSFLHTQ